jgi:Uri superfamily endonuclease
VNFLKGIYALLINLITNEKIKVGSLGVVHFRKGDYIYIGSAMNGITGRIKRHLRDEKKIHWHIDFLLKHTKISKAYYLEGEKRKECLLARGLAAQFDVVKKFGSSDCNCKGHLFYGDHDELLHCIINNKMKELVLGKHHSSFSSSLFIDSFLALLCLYI